jgi:type I restriction-modification system DNA methylase subunit
MAQTNANLIWKIADLLRGPCQPNQYRDVILPFTILRRLDCVVAHQGEVQQWQSSDTHGSAPPQSLPNA